MVAKPTFNILVMVHTRIEWLATLFKLSVEPNRANWIRVEVEWQRQPNWVHTPLFPLSFPRYELENSIMNLYSFPGAIKRDFKLADLNITFNGGLLILDLGNKKLWQRHINRSHLPVEMWDDTLKNAIEEHLYRTASDDPAKVWGVELLKQIDGAKLVLGIRSSSDSVPSTYIKQFLPLNSSVDIVLHDVNPDGWLDLYDSYPPDVIADTLVTMERKLNDNADAPHRN